MVVVKRCSGCGVVKSLDSYSRNRTRPDGHTSWCKECESARKRRYREKNRDKVLEGKRRYYEENRDKVLDYHRRYREENRDKLLEHKRRYHWENRDKLLERKRRYYEENRDKIEERYRRYREENLEYVSRQNTRRENKYQSVTESAATKRGPWSEAEIAILMADDGRTMVAKALELGRTYRSCKDKRQRLCRAGVTN